MHQNLQIIEEVDRPSGSTWNQNMQLQKTTKSDKAEKQSKKNGDTINVVKTWDKTISKEGERRKKSFIEELQVELF